MVGGPPRGVIHETLTTTLPGYRNMTTCPHLTIMRNGQIYQHIPFDRAARSLRNMAGGVQTNRQGSVCVQIEFIGYSDKDDWSTAQITAARKFMQWAEANLGIPFTFPLPVGGPEQYGLKNPLEMSFDQWNRFTGWCEHLHVPENTHWDAGKEAGIRAVFAPATLTSMDEFFKKLEQQITSTGGNFLSLWYVLEFYREFAKATSIPGDNPRAVARELMHRGLSL